MNLRNCTPETLIDRGRESCKQYDCVRNASKKPVEQKENPAKPEREAKSSDRGRSKKKTTHFKENHPVIRTKFRSRNFKEEIETKKHTQ